VAPFNKLYSVFAIDLKMLRV